MIDERKYESLPCPLTEAELILLGDELAREVQALVALKDERKMKVAEIAARTNASEKRIKEISRAIALKTVDREVEVMVLTETPRPGMKRVVRLDTNGTVREELMTIQEMQGSFGFQDRPDDRPEPESKPPDGA